MQKANGEKTVDKGKFFTILGGKNIIFEKWGGGQNIIFLEIYTTVIQFIPDQ